VRWEHLGLHRVALELGFFQLRWYSLAYLAGIVIGWWYLLKLLDRPGAPMARRHADDMVFYATLGIILGGRLGYVFFYRPAYYFQNPLEILQLWDGGMSFHGGVIGVSLGIIYMARKHGLHWLRVHDYVACCVPFGLFFGRIANFVNGELWGRGPTDVPWAVVFPTGGEVARHPSQLYERGSRASSSASSSGTSSGRRTPATSRAASSATSSSATASAASRSSSSASPTSTYLAGDARAGSAWASG
jgi:phosphatidylglycerol:prolipoprotein diacylglycerol transferase